MGDESSKNDDDEVSNDENDDKEDKLSDTDTVTWQSLNSGKVEDKNTEI